MNILDLHNIVKIFGKGHLEVRAVDGVHLHVGKGKVILIMGPSGSGKTTLLTIAGGLLKPTSGQVWINGKEITKLSERHLPYIRQRNIGFIFQQFNLLESLTAWENVEIVLNLAGLKGKKASEKARGLLIELGLEKRLNFLPKQLSGGEKQRVSIARALANDPELILADEPTANLDSRRGHEVMELLKKIAKKYRKTVVIVSHDQRLRDIADKVYWLEDGRFKELAAMATDPVCGMRIEKTKQTAQYKYRNKIYYFCSVGCRGEFINNPGKFLNQKL